MSIENKALEQIWSDVVKVAKFCFSCFGIVGCTYVLGYNLGISNKLFPNFTGPIPEKK